MERWKGGEEEEEEKIPPSKSNAESCQSYDFHRDPVLQNNKQKARQRTVC